MIRLTSAPLKLCMQQRSKNLQDCFTNHFRRIVSQTQSGRIGSLPTSTIPLVTVNSEGAVTRKNLKFDEMLKTLIWCDVDGKKQKMLPLRDLRLFWPKSFKTSYGVLEHSRDVGKMAILPRPKVQCYILDLGNLKLLCRSHQVEILYSDESGSSRRNTVNNFVEDLRSSLSGGGTTNCDTLTFELQVLETALATVLAKLYRQLELVEPLLEGLVNDTVSQPTTHKIGRLAALKKSIFSHNQGIQAIIKALKAVLGNDRDMADMYLDHNNLRDENDHEEVEFLLEAYVSDLSDIEMKSAAMIAHIEDTMQILELHLNSRRNHIMKLSLIMETLAVASGTGAFIGSIFGMNLISGLENHPLAFYYVFSATATLMLSVLTIILLRFRKLVYSAPDDLSQHGALKHFFSYIEVIEAKVKLKDSGISRTEFEAIVNSVIGNAVDPKEIDIFFKVLDRNRDSHLELTELPPIQAFRSKNSFSPSHQATTTSETSDIPYRK